MFWIALMSAVTAANPFPQDFEVGRAAGIRQSGKTDLNVLKSNLLGTWHGVKIGNRLALGVVNGQVGANSGESDKVESFHPNLYASEK